MPNKMNMLSILFSEKSPDIVSIVEHWCDPDGMATMVIPGYKLVSYFCRTSRKHGGTAIYAKIGLRVSDLCISGLSQELESEFCAVKFVLGGVKFGVISVYRPPTGDIQVFLDKTSYILEQCQSIVDNIFLCGDLNIDFSKNGCRLRSLLIDLLDCFNLNVTNLEPTRVFVDRNGRITATKVDYILTNVTTGSCSTTVF